MTEADEERIVFRGMRVLKSWPEQLAGGRRFNLCVIDGERQKRVRYGDEDEDWGAGRGVPCHDCAAIAGELHYWGCDVERCPACGGQMIGCDCPVADYPAASE
jgi:hypothetical protein